MGRGNRAITRQTIPSSPSRSLTLVTKDDSPSGEIRLTNVYRHEEQEIKLIIEIHEGISVPMLECEDESVYFPLPQQHGAVIDGTGFVSTFTTANHECHWTAEIHEDYVVVQDYFQDEPTLDSALSVPLDLWHQINDDLTLLGKIPFRPNNVARLQRAFSGLPDEVQTPANSKVSLQQRLLAPRRRAV